MAISKIKTGSITDSAIDTNKLAANSVTSTDLSTTVITGQTELSESAAGTDVILIYDTSSGTLKKIQASNVGLQAPTLSSISPTSVLTGDGTGNFTFTFTGTGFIASAVPTLITDGGSTVSFDSFTINSNTQITGVIAKSSLTDANEPYDARITVAGALTATLTNQINIDAQPIFNTASGSLGSFSEQTAISTIDIEATDPESAGNVTFEIITGSLPAGLSTATVNEDGVSKFRITGTLSTDVASLTTSNFTVRAADAASNTSTRAFSITELPSAIESFTSTGTFSVPTGITAVDVLVVAGGGGAGGGGNDGWLGGGGGAGGLIFVPGFSVTPGGTVSVTVGCGSNGGAGGNPAGSTGQSGQDSVFGTLTAKGGGGGGAGYQQPAGPFPGPTAGLTGGSGGGRGGADTGGTPGAGGVANQPTQPGQSGSYGFGKPGGGYGGSGSGGGAGGGGAGGAGNNSPCHPSPSNKQGGVGKAYTIADGTTPVTYSPGGGGGSIGGSSTANRGGGGSASGTSQSGAAGAKGIVIVSY